MSRIELTSVLALLSLVAAACAQVAPASAPSIAAATATGAPVQPTLVAATSIEAPTGTAEAANRSTQVTVTLADNTITSSLTDFKVGVPYTFVITNIGRHDHSLTISQPVSVTGSLQASLSSALLDVAKEDLPFGQARTVEYTFPPGAAGKPLEFSCLIPRHYDVGMRLEIAVAP